MKKNYHTNSHSKYVIKLHFVLCVKYRKNLLVGSIKEDILQIIYDIATEKGYIIR
jgi:REP element-mobilizing transposase RayT